MTPAAGGVGDATGDQSRASDRGEPYLEPYRDAVRRHGATFESLLWRNAEFQRTRFRVLIETAELGLRELGLGDTGRDKDQVGDLERVTLADIGCGRADLYDWLIGSGRRVRGYVGVDGVPELVDACEQRGTKHGWQGVSFRLADFVRDGALWNGLVGSGATVLLFSGALNTLEEDAAVGVVERAYAALASSGRAGGVVFNFLNAGFQSSSVASTSAAPARNDPARRFDPNRVLSRVNEFAPRVVLRNDYLGGRDVTVGLFAY
ncbi:MAG: hypothetical protein AAF108_07885 [Planctomycetota bacterium]